MKYHIRIITQAFLIVIGFDFLLHASLLEKFYNQETPFLLSPELSFKLIPLGYLSFLILNILMYWILEILQLNNTQKAFKTGISVGLTIWLSLILGLLSISTIPFNLAVMWCIGQSVEMGIAAWYMEKLRCNKEKNYWLSTFIIFIFLLVIGIIFQSVL